MEKEFQRREHFKHNGKGYLLRKGTPEPSNSIEANDSNKYAALHSNNSYQMSVFVRRSPYLPVQSLLLQLWLFPNRRSYPLITLSFLHCEC